MTDIDDFDFQDEYDDEINDNDEGDSVGFFFKSFQIGGRRISLDDLPPCLRREEGDCYNCDFFSSENCRFLRDPHLIDEIRYLFSITKSEQNKQIEEFESKREAFIKALRTELLSHGRPLHYTVLAKIVSARYPKLDVTDKRVLLNLNWHPEIFEKLREGVYAVVKGKKTR